MTGLKTLCGSCGKEFEAQRSTARFCGDTCRKRARRGVKAGTEQPEQGEQASRGRAKRPLVEAVRKELKKARRLDTVDGQIAILLAEQAAVATGAAASTLTKSLRVAVDRAVEGAATPAAGRKAPVKDEVTKARERREQKARQAARRA